MAIGNKRCSHFNAQKRETSRQNIGGGGTFTMLSPTKLFGGGHVPHPPTRFRFQRPCLLIPTHDTLMQNGIHGNAIRINPSR